MCDDDAGELLFRRSRAKGMEEGVKKRTERGSRQRDRTGTGEMAEEAWMVTIAT